MYVMKGLQGEEMKKTQEKKELADTRLQQYLKMPFSITYSTGELIHSCGEMPYPNC